MQKQLFALLFVTSIFASASRSQAALVDIGVLQTSPGSTSWSLTLSSLTPVGALALLVSDSLTSFTPVPPGSAPPICVLIAGGGCDLQPVPGAPGFNLLMLSFTPAVFTGGPPALLGTFGAASPDAPVQVLPADDVAGGTAFDAQGAAIPDFAIRVVPEPALGALALVAALGALGRVRRFQKSPDGI